MKRKFDYSRGYSLAEATPGAADVRNCTTKCRYRTKQLAKVAARRSTRYGTKVTAYECPTCGDWHLTSVPPDQERARRRA